MRRPSVHATAHPSKPSKLQPRDHEIQAFLDHLARAVTTGDAERIADLWDLPALVIGNDRAVMVTTRDQVIDLFAGARDDYHARGIMAMRADVLQLEWIGDRLAIVRVRWPHLDRHGKEIGAEAADYTLRRGETGTLKLRAALMRGIEKGRH